MGRGGHVYATAEDPLMGQRGLVYGTGQVTNTGQGVGHVYGTGL